MVVRKGSETGARYVTMTDREDAWDAVHEALPAGWTVGPPTYDPGVPGWSVTARSVAISRLKPPLTVSGIGVDETYALRDLDDRLRGVPQPNGSRMAERERRIRLAYIEGARRNSGAMRLRRGLTGEDLRARGRPEPEIGTTPDLGGTGRGSRVICGTVRW